MKQFLLVLVTAVLLVVSASAQGPAYPYSVTLNYTQSTSAGVTGNNAYRAPFTTVCGTYTKLNASPFGPATSYVDNAPAMGAYCYGVTALAPVNGNSTESGLSNIAQNVVIPPSPPTGLGVTVAGGSNPVTFQWAQSTDPINKNKLWCQRNGTGPWVSPFTSTAPVTTKVLTMPAANYECGVTAISNTYGESGLSITVAFATH